MAKAAFSVGGAAGIGLTEGVKCLGIYQHIMIYWCIRMPLNQYPCRPSVSVVGA